MKDRLFLGGLDVLDSASPVDQQYALEFMFGCQTSMEGLFITQLADGIMGMSAHPGVYLTASIACESFVLVESCANMSCE